MEDGSNSNNFGQVKTHGVEISGHTRSSVFSVLTTASS